MINPIFDDVTEEALEEELLDKPIIGTIGIYDEVEVHDNCTVQILKNTITGEISVGWWDNK